MPIPILQVYKNQLADSNFAQGGCRAGAEKENRLHSDRPLVSIITIVRNQESTLESTIQNVINQTYSSIEYILVDGDSTDTTLNIIKKYDDVIDCWISSVDLNTSDAMNKGIALATGDLIGMVSAGDWYADGALETVVKAHLEDREAVIHGKFHYWTEDLQPQYVVAALDDTTENININHLAAFVPRKLYEEIGLFNLDFQNGNDYEWYLRAKLKDAEFRYIDKVITNIRLGGMSDHKWWLNYYEIMQARILHNQGRVSSYIRFARMVIKTLSRKSLESLGLDSIVRAYRKYLAPIKKEMET